MKKYIKLLSYLVGTVFSIFVLAGCGKTEATKVEATKAEGTKVEEIKEEAVKAEEKEEEILVTIADFKVYPASFQIMVANEKGFFDEEFEKVNAKYEVKKFLNGPAINEAFAAGEVDYSAIGLLPGISGINNTKKQEFIGNDLTNYGEAIISYEGSGVNSIADLKGKKVAYAIGTADQTMIELILGDYNLTVSDIQPINVSEEADRENAILTKNVDAILIYEPYLSKILTEDSSLKVIETNENHGSIVPLIARTEINQEHPEVTIAFLKAIQTANEWLEDNLDEAVAIVSKETGVDEDSIRTTFSKNKYELAFGESDFEELKYTTDFLKNSGSVASDFDVDQYINTSYYESFLK